MSEQLAVMLRVLGVAVFNHLWQSTLFAAAVLLVTLLLRQNSARLRHLLWVAASVKFLVPFALVAALGALLPWHPAPAAHEDPLPRVLSVAGDVVAPLSGNMVYPNPFAGTAAGAGVSFTAWLLLAGAVVWLAGVLFVAARWLPRWLAIRRALGASTPVEGIDFPAPVRMTDRLFEPGVVGIWRPVLLLPQGIGQRLTADQMRALLAHERCHLRWRDNLTAALHMRVEALFWFHPLVWWIGARLIEERERHCDEQVLRDGNAPQGYAEAILAVCEHYLAARLPSVSGVSGADLRQRVERIVRNGLVLKLSRPRQVALAAIACGVVALPIGAGMVSGNAVQMLFSSAYSAAMVRYWQLGSALSSHQLRERVGQGSATTCSAPGEDFHDKRNALAATVARLVPDDGEKVLLFAVAANSDRDVRRLLAGGAARTGDGFLQSDSLPAVAAQYADAPMLQLLMEAGFSIDASGYGGIGNFGNTPLMVAISNGRLENADWLIEHGADVSAEDKYGNSPLVNAMATCSDRALVARLLAAGAVPNSKALRIAEHLGVDLLAASAESAAVVPNGLPIDPVGVRVVKEGDVLVPVDPVIVPLNGGTQPLWAPPDFGTLPPPLTDAELRVQWPEPASVDLQADAWRSSSATSFAEVNADFDGDGISDRAVLRVDAEGWRESLFVQLSSVLPDRWQPLFSVPHDQQSQRLQLGVRLAAAGMYRTACGKGFGQCGPGEPRVVRLERPGIEYFQYEDGSSYVFWDHTRRQLQRVWISD